MKVWMGPTKNGGGWGGVIFGWYVGQLYIFILICIYIYITLYDYILYMFLAQFTHILKYFSHA